MAVMLDLINFNAVSERKTRLKNNNNVNCSYKTIATAKEFLK